MIRNIRWWTKEQKVYKIFVSKELPENVFCYITALAQETELKKYSQFLDSFVEALGEIAENDLEEPTSISSDLNALIWLQSTPVEQNTLADLVEPCDNKMLAKVVLALGIV